jgi:hypothetical protein
LSLRTRSAPPGPPQFVIGVQAGESYLKNPLPWNESVSGRWKGILDSADSGPPGIGRNSRRVPHLYQTDLAFSKNIALPLFFAVPANLQLRVNCFNIFNQLNLSPLIVSGTGTHPDQPFLG